MIKDKIICIDLDNTIISTPESLVNLYNKLNPNNKYILHKEIDWKFKPMIKTEEELAELFKLFDHKDFYGDTLVVFPNAIEVINRLAEDNIIFICSKHCDSRKPLTTAWINKVMPKVELIFVDNFADKGKLLKNCDIVIDDRIDSLDSFSDNCFKLLFGTYQWNRGSNYFEVENWNQIEQVINNMFFYNGLNKLVNEFTDTPIFKQEYECKFEGRNNERQ